MRVEKSHELCKLQNLTSNPRGPKTEHGEAFVLFGNDQFRFGTTQSNALGRHVLHKFGHGNRLRTAFALRVQVRELLPGGFPGR